MLILETKTIIEVDGLPHRSAGCCFSFITGVCAKINWSCFSSFLKELKVKTAQNHYFKSEKIHFSILIQVIKFFQIEKVSFPWNKNWILTDMEV